MNRLTLILALCASLITATASAGTATGHGNSTVDLPNIGKVLEVINVAGYTYLHLEGKDKKEWIAGKASEVKEGDVVRYSKGSIMHNFFSKTLNRTFPEILFTSAIQVEGAHPTPANTAATSTLSNASAEQQNNIVKSSVVSTIDSGGYTYVEAQQGDKTVWLAAPKTTVKKGDTIRYANDGAIMTNFYSKTLDREFPKILFVGEVQVIK